MSLFKQTKKQTNTFRFCCFSSLLLSPSAFTFLTKGQRHLVRSTVSLQVPPQQPSLLQQHNNSPAISSIRCINSSFISGSKRSITKITTTKMFSTSPANDNVSSTTTINDVDTVRNLLLKCPTIELRNGMKHPIIGFGTYKVGYIPPSASSVATAKTTSASSGTEPQRTAEECVFDALSIGYRFLECAQFYGNEKQVGNAIQKSGIDRTELFMCSKVWTTTIEQGSDAIRKQLMQTLSDLQTSYVDLYLIHWPVPLHHVQAYKTLIELRNEGYIKGIGVSNYSIEDYLELKNDSTISANDLPLVNQIEINPFLHRSTNTIPFFQKEHVVLQSYRSLRDGKVMDHPVLKEIASHYKPNKTVAQILGRWCIQNKYVYIPKSIKYERMIENANVLDFVLSDEDMKILDTTLTTADALDTYQQLYRKCVNRDTTKDGTDDNVKMNITVD